MMPSATGLIEGSPPKLADALVRHKARWSCHQLMSASASCPTMRSHPISRRRREPDQIIARVADEVEFNRRRLADACEIVHRKSPISQRPEEHREELH